MEFTNLIEVIVTTTTTEHVAFYISLIQGDIGLTGLADGGGGTRRRNHTTSYSSNLAAAKDTVTHTSAIHLNVGVVHTTIVDIAATEDTTTLIEFVGTDTIFCRLIIDFLFVFSGCIEVPVAHIAIHHLEIRGTIDSTTLTATIGITFNSGDTVVEVHAVGLTYYDMCLGKHIVCVGSCEVASM